jgi:hypothetical protein
VRFLVDEVVLGKVFLRVLLFSRFSTIPPMLHAILHLYVALPGQEGEAWVPSRNQYFFSEIGQHWIEKYFNLFAGFKRIVWPALVSLLNVRVSALLKACCYA